MALGLVWGWPAPAAPPADVPSWKAELVAESLRVTRRQVLRSAAGAESFEAAVDLTLFRYDPDLAPEALALIPVVLEWRLVDPAGGGDVALAESSSRRTQELPASMDTGGGVFGPVSVAWTETISFAPAAGAVVDPLAEYEFEVSALFEEPDGTRVPSISGALRTLPERYLVLSGRLRFGAVESTYGETANDPSAVMVWDGDRYRTELGVRGGTVPAAPSRRYGDGTPLEVAYDPATGDADVVRGSQALFTDETDLVVVGGVRVVRGPMTLDADGARLESGGVLLPAGFGISTSQRSLRHRPALEFEPMRLADDLSLPFLRTEFRPAPGQYFYPVCDRLPLRFRTDLVVWELESGSFTFVQVPTADPADPAGPMLTRRFQEEDLRALAPWLDDPATAERPSNDGYLAHVRPDAKVIVGVGSAGEASLSVDLEFEAGWLVSHFPLGVRLAWVGGRMRLERNEVLAGSYLEVPDPITVRYRRDCPGGCGPSSGDGEMIFAAGGAGVYELTRDGGWRAEGRILPERLRWGATELEGGVSPPEGGMPFAHQTSQWSEGAFHAVGGWMAGGEAGALSAELRPQGVLLSGVLAGGGYERPGEAGYREGLGDYAGLNLRVGVAAMSGRSVLAGISTPDYPLKPRCKYYVRASGVTGIHEAVAIQPSRLRMYGFEVSLDGFRLAFRDGQNVESKTGGSIDVPSPVDPPGFELAFKELLFLCRGQPSRMGLANEGETKSLTYWRTDIIPMSLEFAQPLNGACPSVASGFLKVGVETRFPSVTPQKLHATLGFMANGNLVSRANPLSAGLDLDSRFSLPPHLELVGAGGVPWPVTVVGKAYLNNPIPGHPNPDGSSQPYHPIPADFVRPTQGFLTFPATLDVPWFEDLKVQLQVSASSLADDSSQIHVVDGESWRDAGRTYFSNKFHDPDHHGFPASERDSAGRRMTVDEYRNPETPEYNPRARRRWLGVVDFDFPLRWEGTQRRFRSDTQTADLVVLGGVQRRVRSLSPSAAEIAFGVELAVPRINAQSLARTVREGIQDAVAEALTAALTAELRERLGAGLGQLDALLAERPGAVFTESLGTVLDPITDALFAGAAPASLQTALQTVLGSLPDAGLDQAIRMRLEAGAAAIDAVQALMVRDQPSAVLPRLIRELVRRSGVPGASDLGASAIDAALGEALPRIEADLAQASAVLTRVHAAMLRRAETSSTLAGQIRAAFAGTSPALAQAARGALEDVGRAMTGHAWAVASERERREMVRRWVTERFLACETVPKVQYLLRQQVQDLNESFRAALDDVFGQANHLVREVVRIAVRNGSAELAALVGESRNSAVGEMGPSSGGSGKLAALNLEGYAQINDESLRLLQINGRFEFNVPDALRVQAHLRIQEYDANTPPSGCRPAGVAAAVVQIDARAECEWIGSAGTVVEVGAKFSLQDGRPIGFDGYFGLLGEIRLGPVVVNEARLMAGFGGFVGPGGERNHWGYVGAKVRGRFNAYEAGVGMFLGRTCDAAVIRMIDPDVGTVLEKAVGRDSGPMTGVYFYGEAWIPINEVFGIPSTCLFTVRATAGAGFFGFIHDNGAATIGCKQKYGADGRLLCLLGISGEMRIIGALTTAGQPTPATGAGGDAGLFRRADQPDTSQGSFVLFGAGEFAAELGICPFCLELSKSVGLIWTIGGPNAGLDFEL